MPVNDYLYEFGVKSSFRADVKDVMRYAGGLCVQALPTGEWLYDSNDAKESDEVSTTFKSTKLTDIESVLWDLYVQKKIQ